MNTKNFSLPRQGQYKKRTFVKTTYKPLEPEAYHREIDIPGHWLNEEPIPCIIHAFGMEGEDSEISMAAVVEFEDGTLDTVHPSHLQLNPLEASE